MDVTCKIGSYSHGRALKWIAGMVIGNNVGWVNHGIPETGNPRVGCCARWLVVNRMVHAARGLLVHLVMEEVKQAVGI